MNRFLRLLVFAFSGVIASPLFGHGENKPGPNKGYIRMPGAFHTEVVPNGDDSFTVFLLDVHFKNPTTERSSVVASINIGTVVTPVVCAPKDSVFECTLPKNTKLTEGTLEIVATRQGSVAGGPARYLLPLSFERY